MNNNKRMYYKCLNDKCIDFNWLVWYPYGAPEEPTCNSCLNKYETRIEEE